MSMNHYNEPGNRALEDLARRVLRAPGREIEEVEAQTTGKLPDGSTRHVLRVVITMAA